MDFGLKATNVDVSECTDGTNNWHTTLWPGARCTLATLMASSHSGVGESTAVVCRLLDPAKPFGLGFDHASRIVRVYVPGRDCDLNLIKDAAVHGEASGNACSAVEREYQV